MKNHLLSLFPLQHENAYVRVSCVAIEEPVVACCQPYTTSRERLIELLAATSFAGTCAQIVTRLDDGFQVQLTIDDEDARKMGGQPKLN